MQLRIGVEQLDTELLKVRQAVGREERHGGAIPRLWKEVRGNIERKEGCRGAGAAPYAPRWPNTHGAPWIDEALTVRTNLVVGAPLHADS